MTGNQQTNRVCRISTAYCARRIWIPYRSRQFTIGSCLTKRNALQLRPNPFLKCSSSGRETNFELAALASEKLLNLRTNRGGVIAISNQTGGWKSLSQNNSVAENRSDHRVILIEGN